MKRANPSRRIKSGKRGTTRVEFCGGIASGKTTLTKLLQIENLTSVFEDFGKNPFYRAFYHDPVGTAFETELTFLSQHYHLEKSVILRIIRSRNFTYKTPAASRRTISLTYLSKINDALDARITILSRSEKVLVIDGDGLDFTHDSRARGVVHRQITRAFANAWQFNRV